MATGQEVGAVVSDAGSKFETLMNIQPNPLEWTDAAKQEIQTILSSLETAKDMADDMNPPAIIADIHPLLVSAIEEMNTAVAMMAELGANPADTTEEKLEAMVASIVASEEHINEYATKMEQTLGEKYPDLIQE